VAGLLSELVDKSMVVVERDGGTVRYRLLDTLREFGAERLSEGGASGAYRQAHAAYYLSLAEELGPAVRGPEEGEAVGRIDAAIDDLRSSHAWMVAAENVDGALRLPVALADDIFYRLRDEMITWTHRGLALDGACQHPACPAALATAAMGATHRGEYGRASRERTSPTALVTSITWRSPG
jgi:predicted ATPase